MSMKPQRMGAARTVEDSNVAQATLEAVRKVLQLGAEPDTLKVEVVSQYGEEVVRVVGESEVGNGGWREAQARAPLHSQPIDELAKLRQGLRTVIVNLEAHERQEGEPLDYRTAGGSWRDMQPDLQALLDGRDL